MHCSRCGTDNHAENRYCVNCGSGLSDKEAPPVSLRERLGRLIGTSRRARLASAVTAMALAVSIAAFVVLEPDEGDATPADTFIRAADRICVEQKGRVATLERQTLQQQGNVAVFASALVTVLTEWRFAVRDLPATALDTEAAQALDSALLDVLVEAGALARAARTGSTAEIAAEANSVDEASIEVDRQIETLDLEECSSMDA